MGPVNNLSTYALAETLLFLPGASGNLQLWQPVSAGLCHPGRREFISWPGFGDVQSEPGVNGTHDLVAERAPEVIPCIESFLAV